MARKIERLLVTFLTCVAQRSTALNPVETRLNAPGGAVPRSARLRDRRHALNPVETRRTAPGGGVPRAALVRAAVAAWCAGALAPPAFGGVGDVLEAAARANEITRFSGSF